MVKKTLRQINREEEDARIDWGIIFCVLVLAVIGLASIYVALRHDTSTVSIVRTMLSQFVWYVIGTVAVIFLMQFDAEQLWKIAPIAYGLGIFLLIAVLIFYSRSYFVQTGAKSWFAIGPFTFQPSEVMKPAYILMMGRIISQHNAEYYEHTTRSDWHLLGKMFLWTLPVAVLLKLQNDFGTMLVFFAILAGMILVSGITWKIIVPVGTIGVALGSTAIFLAVYARGILEKMGFHTYQFERIDAWLNPSGSTDNKSYQLYRSIQAIGSGKLFGKGFNVSNVYVPVRESDMIFSVIGENFGFIGCCVLIFIYLLLIFQMIQVTLIPKTNFMLIFQRG